MAQQPSTSVLDTGHRLDQDPVLWLLIQYRLRQSLSDELLEQILRSVPMQEVRSLAKDMKEQIAALRKQYASSDLPGEIARASINAEKVAAFTQELKDANKEVEDFLGETGSNFNPTTVETAKTTATDINGVTVNQENTK